MGTRFATRAVEALNNGDINQIMVYHDGDVYKRQGLAVLMMRRRRS